ncbi:acetyltransferase, GNAT family protein [Spiroplasma sp. NBRC 100390]|uniref:GNAT family N-acetyltransferase n=1 Tax=unclassified Spiroplasma TaxID=2637901 RepID=UPI0008929202|nr:MULTISPECIES: GNAT family N-acetyltransferase [unclassified Spiroplasma]AOX43996.1 acetyltransferase, GNAT family protein [Spiroplasma sp. TU-14]APE13466.1 acetyltransferase, GNAT family protein [Spiroplasma sp. NBRC 100390]
MQNTIIFKSALGNNNSIYADAIMIRKIVFVDEQQVPLAEEVDQYDQTADHLVGYHDNEPVCCARILQQNGKWFLGRIAVLKSYRHQQVGILLLQTLLKYVKTKHQPVAVYLFAQKQVVGFYAKLGFIKYGESFIDANIVHFPMVYYYNNN